MDRFVNRQNIARYRRLANETTNAAERKQILRLLANEEAKFKLDGSVDGVGKSRRPDAGKMLDEGAGR